MFLLNSCLGQFSAATFTWHSFSRSYGVILPSSLTTLLPPTLGSSPHPPVSVYGTGPCYTIAAFLDRKGPQLRYFCFAPHHAFVSCRTDFPILRLPRLHRAFHSRLCFPSRVPAVLITRGAGIFYLLSIGYASLPLLRPRLTQSRSALLWKPWIFGHKDSHLILATHSGILSSMQSTAPYGTASSRMQCSSTNLSVP